MNKYIKNFWGSSMLVCILSHFVSYIFNAVGGNSQLHAVTAKEMYEIDRCAIEEIGLPGTLLMENAGQSIVREIVPWLALDQRIAILIGSGNNGGDGFVIARQLLSKGYKVDALLIPSKEKIKGDARKHMEWFEASGYTVRPFNDQNDLKKYSVLIDTMLGIGFKGELRQPYRDIIEACNDHECLKVAIDIPSGISADGGYECKTAFKANITVTLQSPKLSAFSYPEASYYGELIVADIGIPVKAYKGIPQRKIWGASDVKGTLPIRNPNSHKGNHGKGLIIAGSVEMTGAPVLTARAAHRSGAGLLTAAVPASTHSIIASHLVESTFSVWPDSEGGFNGEIPIDLSSFNGLTIGPGIGRSEGARVLVREVVSETSVPLVIDADGLYHLSTCLNLLKGNREGPVIVTPHMGEMSRLTGLPISEIEANRFEISKRFAMEFGVYVVLKGPYTLITTPDGKQFVNTTGNSALAKGGSGDVLTGIILGLVLQSEKVEEALCNAVYIHGKAADQLVETTHSSMDVLASDIIETLPSIFRTFLT